MVVNVDATSETGQKAPSTQSMYKSLGASVILAIIINVGGAIWWTSNANSRLDSLEKFVQDSKSFPERIVRLETTISVVDERTERIEDKVDRVLADRIDSSGSASKR